MEQAHAGRPIRPVALITKPSIIAAALVLAAVARPALAERPLLEPSEEVPCAILEKFEGRVQLLDPTRTRVRKVESRTPVPCGGWVSVHEGWADLRHRQGFEFRLGRDSFAEIFDNDRERELTGDDHLVLYHGKVHVSAYKGDGECRVVTPNARARIRDAVSLVIYDKSERESQLVSIQKRVSLENRHETSRKVELAPGEASSLNFNALRTIPATARAVSVASLKRRLSGLNLDAPQVRTAIASAYERGQRTFPVLLKDRGSGGHAPRYRRKPKKPKLSIELEDGRVLGGRGKDGEKKYSYERHPQPKVRSPASAGGDDRDPGEKTWVRKLVGGEKSGEQVLFPDKYYGRKQQARVEVEDRGSRSPGSVKEEISAEEKERRRLIEELSKIRSY